MTDTTMADSIAKTTVEEIAHRQAEPSWLLNDRLKAWEAYFQTPMPTKRDEDWHRTDISSLDMGHLVSFELKPTQAASLSELGANACPAWLDRALNGLASRAGVLYINTLGAGFLELRADLKDKGVVLCDIRTAVEKHPDLVRGFFTSSARSEEDGKFSLLAKALFNCGLFLYVPAKLVVDEPFIFAVNVDDAKTAAGGALLPRSIVLVEEQGSAKLVCVMGSDTEVAKAELLPSTLIAQHMDIQVRPAAKLSLLDVQDVAANAILVNRSNAYVGRGGRFESFTLALSGRQVKSDLATSLTAPGAASEILGLVLGSGQERFSFNTIQDHLATDTESDINFRVALQDQSTSVYQGIIRVDKVAQRTNAYQSNKNLLLSQEAKADSIPKLEILADDVKCSHGATVGPVDKEQLFYLMSRGLAQVEAEQLVVLGFFRQVLERVPVSGAFEWLSEMVSKKILGGAYTKPAPEELI